MKKSAKGIKLYRFWEDDWENNNQKIKEKIIEIILDHSMQTHNFLSF